MTTRPLKLLLVEADAAFAAELARRLRTAVPAEMVLDVLTTGSLTETMKLLAKNQRVDVIFLDVHLPDTQGSDGYQRLRARLVLPRS